MIRVIECKTKFSNNDKLKSVALESKHCRFIELDATYSEDRKRMMELISNYHRHQFVHNISSSEINDSGRRIASNTKFYCNVEIHFPTDAILEQHMLLMKEIKYLFFNWTLDDGTHNESNHLPLAPKGNSEHG